MSVQSSNTPASADRAVAKRGAGLNQTKLPMAITIFFVGLVIPVSVYVGPVRLSPYRLMLLAMLIPSFFMLLSGKAGKIRSPDICVIVICVWSSVSLIYHHGLGAKIEPIGIFFIDLMGSYLIGRVFIRSPETFFKMVRLLFILMLVLTPFALYETITSKNLILDVFSKIGSTPGDIYKDKRWGLDRVQGPFGHPIHWGVFFGTFVGMTHYALGYGQPLIKRWLGTFMVLFIGGLSMSSGPLVALLAQMFFIGWDWLFRKVKARWYILTILAVMAYIVVDFLSNRNPFEVFVYYLAFDAHTAGNRILIFEWGMKNIFDNPVFGIGHNTWERLSWMTPSFDMFWLIFPMQHGVIVMVSFFWLFFWVFLKAASKKISNLRVSAYRIGFTSSLFGLFVSGWTVHFWDPILVLLLFLLGAGVWFVDYDDDASGKQAEEADLGSQRKIRYSRFDPIAV